MAAPVCGRSIVRSYLKQFFKILEFRMNRSKSKTLIPVIRYPSKTVLQVPRFTGLLSGQAILDVIAISYRSWISMQVKKGALL